jgi:hypothetical protein
MQIFSGIKFLLSRAPVQCNAFLVSCKGACWWQGSQAQEIKLGIKRSSLISAQKLRKTKYTK